MINSVLLDTEIAKLPVERQNMLINTYNSRKKDGVIAWVLWIFGFHYLYFGQVGKWLLFFLTAGGFGIWWIQQAFVINRKIEDNNNDLKSQLLVQYKAIQ